MDQSAWFTAEPARSARGREFYALRAVDVLAVAAFWATLAFISAASRELDPRIPGLARGMTVAVVRATYVEYALWAVLTLPILWMASRYSIEGGRRTGRLLLFVLLGLAIALAMDTVMLHVREELMTDPLTRFRRPTPPLPGLWFLDDLMVYVAVLGAGIARDYFLRYQARHDETIQLQAQLTQARLDVLRSQLDPHFLFNTLNSISALVERDPRGTRRMIARLSDLLRHTLEESTDAEVPLHRELDLLEEYIELMQIRFQGKLEVRIDAASDVRNALVPNLLLQPIVENAIKHGVGRQGGGSIAIVARREGDTLSLLVRDDGPGAPDQGGDLGVGLTNTNARLAAMYGDAHQVRLRRDDGATLAEITVPFHTASAVGGA